MQMRKTLKIFVYPYKMGSRSAKKLSSLLEAKRIKPFGRYRPRSNHIIVSLGSSTTPLWESIANLHNVSILNRWNMLEKAQNKLTAFIELQRNGVPIPSFTANIEVARTFFTQARSVVFCRTLLRAHGGRGIVIARSPAELVPAPLYTKYFKKEKEYRVHVFKNQVIDVAQKRLVNLERRELNPNRNLLIRNLENGWIYARDSVSLPIHIQAACIQACNVLDLDFGAVDIAINEEGQFVIFEVNTAPGLEGTTLAKYASAILQYKEQKENENIEVQRYS